MPFFETVLKLDTCAWPLGDDQAQVDDTWPKTLLGMDPGDEARGKDRAWCHSGPVDHRASSGRIPATKLSPISSIVGCIANRAFRFVGKKRLPSANFEPRQNGVVRCAEILWAGCALAICTINVAAQYPPAPPAIFNADPHHLWNRTYAVC